MELVKINFNDGRRQRQRWGRSAKFFASGYRLLKADGRKMMSLNQNVYAKGQNQPYAQRTVSSCAQKFFRDLKLNLFSRTFDPIAMTAISTAPNARCSSVKPSP